MKLIIFLLIPFCLSACIFGCISPNKKGIDPLIQPYFNNFKQEASIRKFDFDYSDININFGETNGSFATTYYSSKSIIIDSATLDWKRTPESVVFHELGHLLLHRSHCSTKYTSSRGFEYAKSIMYKYGPDDYETPIHTYRRDYYVNELFDPSTPRPEWME